MFCTTTKFVCADIGATFQSPSQIKQVTYLSKSFTINLFSKPSTLKTRIINLNQKLSPKTSLYVYSALIPVCAALSFICMSFSTYSFSESQPGAIFTLALNLEIRDRGKVFTAVEQNPKYSGDERALFRDLSSSLKSHYPSEAKRRKFQGMVLVNFIVETDGQIS